MWGKHGAKVEQAKVFGFFKWALFDDFFNLDNWALDIKWTHNDNNK